MAYRITFAAGMAVGYVLGTRAGRERYEEIRKAAQDFVQNPAVRNACEAASVNGRKAAGKAAGTVGRCLPESVTVRLQAACGHKDQNEADDWGTTNT
jgi:hypothetical protein